MQPVRLEPWTTDGINVLHALNTPDARRHLGGVETPDRLLERHRRYLDLAGTAPGMMYRVHAGDDAVGLIGFWEREWRDALVYETGWAVVAEHHGRGIASAAGRLLVDRARADGRHRHLHAFSSVDNAASNALCGRLGFTLLGATELDFPPGTRGLWNDWRLDLTA
ncbi:GNAT family N-acetyltransferase [Actinomadura flavalba]|uniref:GNAT family N-acetyltransferase n=1 Tax=Actinomadura flavalba TaxID=1120938 RepID=UPI00036D98A7|nr:GNAT family N-acetyltransferase [Actinomadura flavalba]